MPKETCEADRASKMPWIVKSESASACGVCRFAFSIHMYLREAQAGRRIAAG